MERVTSLIQTRVALDVNEFHILYGLKKPIFLIAFFVIFVFLLFCFAFFQIKTCNPFFASFTERTSCRRRVENIRHPLQMFSSSTLDKCAKEIRLNSLNCIVFLIMTNTSGNRRKIHDRHGNKEDTIWNMEYIYIPCYL